MSSTPLTTDPSFSVAPVAPVVSVFFAFRCSNCAIMNYSSKEGENECRKCKTIINVIPAEEDAEPEKTPTEKCNICLDDKTTNEFNHNVANRKIVCPCFAFSGHHICINCLQGLETSNNLNCPFCRREGFLARLENGETIPILPEESDDESENLESEYDSEIEEPSGFVSGLPIITNEAWENTPETTQRTHTMERFITATIYNTELYNWIIYGENLDSPYNCLYYYLYHDLIRRVGNRIIRPNDFFICRTQFVPFTYAERLPRPFEFNLIEQHQGINDTEYFDVYIRDEENDSYFNLYQISVFTRDTLINQIDDNLNLSRLSPSVVNQFINCPRIRRNLTPENPIWEFIADVDDYRCEGFLEAIIDREALIDSLISNDTYSDVLGLGGSGFYHCSFADYSEIDHLQHYSYIVETDDGIQA